MEAIVSMSVFITVITIATTIFLLANDSEQRTRSNSNLQAVAQSVIEAVVRNARLSNIDYPYYLSNGITVDPTNELVLSTVTGSQIRYRVQNDVIQSCSCEGLNCIQPSACDPLWSDLTSVDNVVVERLDFYVTPFSDPFLLPTKEPDCKGYPTDNFDETVGLCQAPAGCWTGMTLFGGYCYNPNKQPKVQIVLSVNNGKDNEADKVSLSLQTAVTTRVYER